MNLDGLKEVNIKGLNDREAMKRITDQNNELIRMLKETWGRKFLVPAVPTDQLIRGQNAFYTRFLEGTSPNNDIRIDCPTLITHIYRGEDTYDSIDGAVIAGGYTGNFIQIMVDGFSLSNIAFDISALPRTRQYALRLPVPLYVDDGSRITLEGGAGLTSLKIGLQGYRLHRRLTNKERLLKPYLLFAKIESTDRYKTMTIPSWMALCLTDCWNFVRIKPSDSTKYGFGDYARPVYSAVDGNYNCNITSLLEYWHGGQQNQNLWHQEPSSAWCGTREWPASMHNLWPDLSTNIEVQCDAVSPVANAIWYRWMVLMGVYEPFVPTRVDNIDANA